MSGCGVPQHSQISMAEHAVGITKHLISRQLSGSQWTDAEACAKPFRESNLSLLRCGARRHRRGHQKLIPPSTGACFSSGRWYLLSENVVVIFGWHVTGETGSVQRLVAKTRCWYRAGIFGASETSIVKSRGPAEAILRSQFDPRKIALLSARGLNLARLNHR